MLAAASSILQDSNTTALENPLFPLIDSLVAKNVFDFNWRKRQRNFTSVFVKLNSTFRVLRLTAMVSDLKQFERCLDGFLSILTDFINNIGSIQTSVSVYRRSQQKAPRDYLSKLSSLFSY